MTEMTINKNKGGGGMDAEKKKAGLERRDFLRVMGAGAAAAVPLLAAGRA